MEGNGPAARSQLKLSKKLQALSGLRYCTASDLSKAVLIARLKALGELQDVETVDIQVETLSADSFRVTLETKKAAVGKLKKGIEHKYGARDYLQDIYRLSGSRKADGSLAGEPLKDKAKLSAPCSVLLCVNVETGNVQITVTLH